MAHFIEIQPSFSINVFSAIFMFTTAALGVLLFLQFMSRRKREKEIIETQLGINQKEKLNRVWLSYESIYNLRLNYSYYGGDKDLISDLLIEAKIKEEINKAETLEDISLIFSGYGGESLIGEFSKKIHFSVLADKENKEKIIQVANQEFENMKQRWEELRKKPIEDLTGFSSEKYINDFVSELKKPFFYDPDLNFELWPLFYNRVNELRRME